MILPEIGVALNRRHYACWGADTLEEALPKTCPCCGAERIKPTTVFHCGAEYKSKPQGQTHTDVYWGICPARAEKSCCDTAGLAHDTPPGIVADKLADMDEEVAEFIVRRQCKV